MPFVSRQQAKFAFATHQPWAKEWASKTDFNKLPDRRASAVNKIVSIKRKGG